METITLQEQLPVNESYDVIVAGGGVAGVTAAISAARKGCRTMLIEKSLKLGGLATLGLINLFVPMCNGRGKRIIYGMTEELSQLSIRYGYGNPPAEFKDGQIPQETLDKLKEQGQVPPAMPSGFPPTFSHFASPSCARTRASS